MDHSPTEKSK